MGQPQLGSEGSRASMRAGGTRSVASFFLGRPHNIKESHFFTLTYLSPEALLLAMADTNTPEIKPIFVKGKVVILRRLRREFEIDIFTKAVLLKICVEFYHNTFNIESNIHAHSD